MAQSGSFIPQQTSTRPPKVRRRRIYIINYVVYTFFFGVGITAIGLVFWHWQLNSQLSSLQADLTVERDRFDQSDLITVKENEALLKLVQYLLDNQPALSKVLAAVEETTVATVQLTEFSIDAASGGVATENTQASLTLTYTGTADSFSTLLAQRAVLRTNPLLARARISDIAYGGPAETGQGDSTKDVSYEVALSIPVSDIMFEGLALASSASTETETAVAETLEGETTEESANEVEVGEVTDSGESVTP